MAERLPVVSGQETVRRLVKAGWGVARQKGSHIMLTKIGFRFTLSVPAHPELGPGLLHKILRQAELTIEDFDRLGR